MKKTLSYLAITIAATLIANVAAANNFGRVYYDAKNDRLVVTMVYRGTNPNHHFTLQWGKCQSNQSGDLPGVTVDVLDDQFNDLAQQDFRKTIRFKLNEMPCGRPASVTLRTAPRFFYTLTIPAAAATN
jgi:hypothetical protein